MSAVEDELAIRNLIARVARLTDQWTRVEELTAEYTTDCEWQIEGGPAYCGREGIARRIQANI